ncbi:hypothetical protein V2J09_000612 [Rumex salicifolius]
MQTRSKLGIHVPKIQFNLTTDIIPLPKSHKFALQNPQWFHSMKEEFDALINNRTWDLVPRPSHANVVTRKWIFRHKFDANGKLSRFESHWGIDFNETFSPIVKLTTVRTILSLSITHRWPVHQLDVKNAFLHGQLNEVVYCQQPPGFVDLPFPDHVCKLIVWFETGLACVVSTVCRICLYTLISGNGTQAYLLVYIDDIILTASSSAFLRQIIDALSTEFSISDLGPLQHFLGVIVSTRSEGLFLSQE